MKNLTISIILLILVCCNSDKISGKSINLNNQAVNSLRSEKYSEALKYSDDALQADNKNYQAYTIKAQALIKQNKIDEAEETVQEQLKIKPDFAKGWIFKVLINSLKKNHIQAKYDFERSVQLFEQRDHDNNFNSQLNDLNVYFSLLLIGDMKSQKKMQEIEDIWENYRQAYQTMISLEKISKKELINKMLTE